MSIDEIENKIAELQKEIEALKKTESEDQDEIYLLSVEEYEEYKDKIPYINTWWFLRSPGLNSKFAAGVNYDNSIFENGYRVNYGYGAVRPALRYANLKSQISESAKGKDYFILNETRWKIIDREEEIAISELPIGFKKFDDESNDYENSHIRQWLLNWLKGDEEESNDYEDSYYTREWLL